MSLSALRLLRFVQSDTIVPSANTSQALNRYAYVANNPLKFTDPSGHGWFSNLWKKVRGWIGTIVTVGLICLGVPYPIASVIGSAVGTIVNGGTFKSFVIGAGIGIAAGGIANALGGVLGSPGLAAAVEAGTATTGEAVLFGTLAGMAAGAISSCVYGTNVGKAMLEGAEVGAITAWAVYGARQYAARQAADQAHGESVVVELSADRSTVDTVAADPAEIVGGDEHYGTGAMYDSDDLLTKGFAEAADDYEFYHGAKDWREGITNMSKGAYDNIGGETTYNEYYIFGHGNTAMQFINGVELKPNSWEWQCISSHVTKAVHLRGCLIAQGSKGLQYIQDLADIGGVTVTAFDDLVYYPGTSFPGADYYSYGGLWKAVPGSGRPEIISPASKGGELWRWGRR